jgi:mRNA-degrading endonuclease RelE of RelBE toxin-antitoxin system
MLLLETSKFQKLRKKLKDKDERAALREAVLHAVDDPESGKKLKGEFQDLRALRFSVRGQARRLIYKHEDDKVILFSFGPRQGVYK